MQLFLQSAYLSSLLSVVYIALLYRSHPFHRLPMAPVLTTFIVGMISVIPVLLLYRAIPPLRMDGVLGTVLIAPLVEESIKLAAFGVTARRLGYPTLVDALDYAVLFGVLGVGFAVYEDFWYIFGSSYSSWVSGDLDRFYEVFRWITVARSFPGHILFNAIAGLVIGETVCRAGAWRSARGTASALMVAFAMHALFNLVARQQSALLLWSLVISYIGVFLALRRRAMERSPFLAVQRRVTDGREEWSHPLSPVQVLFAEGFAWPGTARARFLAFYPLLLSLVVLFPLLVSCVYLLHRWVSMGMAP